MAEAKEDNDSKVFDLSFFDSQAVLLFDCK